MTGTGELQALLRRLCRHDGLSPEALAANRAELIQFGLLEYGTSDEQNERAARKRISSEVARLEPDLRVVASAGLNLDSQGRTLGDRLEDAAGQLRDLRWAQATRSAEQRHSQPPDRAAIAIPSPSTMQRHLAKAMSRLALALSRTLVTEVSKNDTDRERPYSLRFIDHTLIFDTSMSYKTSRDVLTLVAERHFSTFYVGAHVDGVHDSSDVVVERTVGCKLIDTAMLNGGFYTLNFELDHASAPPGTVVVAFETRWKTAVAQPSLFVFRPTRPAERVTVRVHFEQDFVPDEVWVVEGVEYKTGDPAPARTGTLLVPNSVGDLEWSFEEPPLHLSSGLSWSWPTTERSV